MSINKLFCSIFLLLSSYCYAGNISLEINKSSFSVGDLLEISASSNKDEIDVTEADVYLSIQFPDGSLYYWYDFEIMAVNEAGKTIPLLTNWTIQTLPKTTIFAFKIPIGFDSGTYKWYLTLAKPGSDVEQPTNWIASTSATLVLDGKPTTWMPDPSTVVEVEADESEGSSAGSKKAEKADGGMYIGDITSPSERPSSPPPSYADEAEYSDSSDSIAFDDDYFAGESVEMSTGADYGEKISDAEAPSFEAAYDMVDGMIADEPMIMPPYPDERPTPVAGTLTAGDIDDNLNFTAFQNYRNRQNDNSLPFVTLSDRILLNIVDNAGKGMSNAKVRLDNKLDMYTGTDGRFYLFPEFDGLNKSQIDLQLLAPEDEFGSASSVFTTSLDLEQLADERSLTITMPDVKSALPHSLDIMFVVDTTGSMADELNYLITELRDIVNTVQARHKQVHMRFGLIVYRDINDKYVVQNFDFTNSLNDMQEHLNKQKARGGGDYPEAMEQALEEAVNVEWSAGNVARLLFLVADAPPHDENLKVMFESVHTARNKGIRIYPLAASGVGDKAEFMMRNAEVLTQGRYLFLTDDSGVGGSHQEPSTPCYIVTHLDKLIARVIDGELAGQRIEPNAKDILRSVGNYDAGVCSETEPPLPPPPVDKLSKAKVENIQVQIMESFPVQVQVVAQGYLSDGCEKIKQSTSSRDENMFTVKITTHSVGEFCTEAEEPFTENVTLDVKGLKAGTYTVDVNGIKDKFKLDMDNM
ncbi:vWA domain-containing protein [Candidatus Halobeggiatoa sp. HSG11]|nr:vWA domain-containing protein [Candidatus Halobeggiatoa sp. HSG11]